MTDTDCCSLSDEDICISRMLAELNNFNLIQTADGQTIFNLGMAVLFGVIDESLSERVSCSGARLFCQVTPLLWPKE